MFANARAFTDDLSAWEPTNVFVLSRFFWGASFELAIGKARVLESMAGWDFSSVREFFFAEMAFCFAVNDDNYEMLCELNGEKTKWDWLCEEDSYGVSYDARGRPVGCD